MSESPWNPDQYDRFKQERSQPFFELLDMVRPQPDMCAIDLGCGAGEHTVTLHERLGCSRTVGIDTSDKMLARAASHAQPGLEFVNTNIAELDRKSAYDLVFSNAALHWLPGHEALFLRLCEALKPGGQLAVQVPANDDHPSHTVAAFVASQLPFRSILRGHTRSSPVLTPEGYARLLNRLGFGEQIVRLVVYPHLLESRNQVVEWVRGTLLTSYEKRMPPGLFRKFVETYQKSLNAVLPDDRPFFFPFKRILMWARKDVSTERTTER